MKRIKMRKGNASKAVTFRAFFPSFLFQLSGLYKLSRVSALAALSPKSSDARKEKRRGNEREDNLKVPYWLVWLDEVAANRATIDR